MTVLLENRTISMILMVPDVDALSSSSSTPIIEQLDRSDVNNTSLLSNIKHDQPSDNTTISSMPVYHGSIIRIEQHNDDKNASDLIIRVPNFHRQRLASDETDSKLSPPTTGRIKRRAPICPLLYGPTPNLSTTNSLSNINNLNQSRVTSTNTNRITTGLRSLSRAFTHSCKSKRSSSISEMPVPSSLPDIEVMNEKIKVSISSNKNLKNENSTSSIPKLSPPKVLFVKRKDLKIRKKQTSSSSTTSAVSNDIQTDLEKNPINLTSTSTSTIITTQYAEVKKPNLPKITRFYQEFIEQNDFSQQTNVIENNDNEDNNDQEQQDDSMRLGFDVEQQFAAISQLISDLPLSSIDGESLSTHRYSTISATVPDIRIFPPDYNQESVSSPDQTSSIGISSDLDSKPSSSTQIIGNIISSKNNRPFRIQTSMLQPDISVIRIGITDLTTPPDRSLPGEKIVSEQIDTKLDIEPKEENESSSEQGWYEIFHPDDETFAESYEVTYQLDPQFINDKGQISDLTTWLPIISQNEYEHIESDNNTEQKDPSPETKDHLQTISKEEDTLVNNMTQTKSCSVDDLSRTSNDQASTYQPESLLSSSSTSSSSSSTSSRHCTLQRSNSYNGFGVYVSTDLETHREHFIHQVEDSSPGEHAGLKENDRILCINGTPVINEDYTVVLQLIQHGLQTDTLDFDVISNEAYEQFKSHIDQIYQ